MKKTFIIILLILTGFVFLSLYFLKSTPLNERPMYGFASYEEYISNRTEDMRVADDAMVENVKKIIEDKSVEGVVDLNSATEHTCQLGKKYYEQGDFKTAMKRFNQAWQLDSSHKCAYEGFNLLGY